MVNARICKSNFPWFLRHPQCLSFQLTYGWTSAGKNKHTEMKPEHKTKNVTFEGKSVKHESTVGDF